MAPHQLSNWRLLQTQDHFRFTTTTDRPPACCCCRCQKSWYFSHVGLSPCLIWPHQLSASFRTKFINLFLKKIVNYLHPHQGETLGFKNSSLRSQTFLNSAILALKNFPFREHFFKCNSPDRNQKNAKRNLWWITSETYNCSTLGKREQLPWKFTWSWILLLAVLSFSSTNH